MSEHPQATRFYLIAAVLMLAQTGIAFLVNTIIGFVSILLTAFVFLAVFFAYRGTEGIVYDRYTQTHAVGTFPSGGCGIMLGPMTIVAVLITFVVNIPGESFPNFLYVIPAILAAVFMFYAGMRMILDASK